jgi:hypothetical protein
VNTVGLLEIVVIVLVVLWLLGYGGYGRSRWGWGPGGDIVTLLIVIALLAWLFGWHR